MEAFLRILSYFNNKIRNIERSRRYARRQNEELAHNKVLFKQEMTSFKIIWNNFNSCSKKSICYFSTFDQDSIVDDYVLFHLKKLKELGLDIVLISTSPTIPDSYIEVLKNHVSAIVHRNNIGLDFFSWKIGMLVCPFEDSTEHIYLVNDSVYGPLFSLVNVFTSMEKSRYDVWGITDSWFTTYHLQSYFIGIKLSALTSKILKHFFENVKIIRNKEKLIVEYEMGLTKAFLREGLKVGALCDFREIYKRFYSEKFKNDRLTHFNHATNPTVNYWKELITSRLCPYLKTSLLREDYLSEVDPRNLEEIFENIESELKIDIVIDHQKRVSNGKFP